MASKYQIYLIVLINFDHQNLDFGLHNYHSLLHFDLQIDCAYFL
jgi:hypothetical protein